LGIFDHCSEGCGLGLRYSLDAKRSNTASAKRIKNNVTDTKLDRHMQSRLRQETRLYWTSPTMATPSHSRNSQVDKCGSAASRRVVAVQVASLQHFGPNNRTSGEHLSLNGQQPIWRVAWGSTVLVSKNVRVCGGRRRLLNLSLARQNSKIESLALPGI
jgi:hypothetical protein